MMIKTRLALAVALALAASAAHAVLAEGYMGGWGYGEWATVCIMDWHDVCGAS